MDTKPLTTPVNRDVLQRVLDVSRVMAETRTLQPLLERVMDEAVDLAGAERGYLVMLGALGAHEVRMARGLDASEEARLSQVVDQNLRDQISDSIIDRVVSTGEPLIVRDAINDPQFSIASSIITLKLRSIMCVPLISHGTLIGALYVENRTISGRFKEADLPPLTLFANQAAVAIENAALNEELEARVEKRTHELQVALSQLEGSWMNLVENNRLQTEMLANVTHDLRSPLTIVVGTLSALQDESLGPLSEEQKEWVQKSLEAVQHVMSLTNDVFDLTKLDLGGLTLYPKAVVLGEFLDSVFKIALGLRWPPGVSAHLDLATDLPNVTLDPIRMRQVLLNLLSNALRYTEQGNITLHARYWSERAEVQIGVADTGAGILPENAARLFTRFTQSDDNMERRQQGTGLGLAISKQLVEMHKGRIWVESTPGQGSDFIFALGAHFSPPRHQGSKNEMKGATHFKPPHLFYWPGKSNTQRLRSASDKKTTAEPSGATVQSPLAMRKGVWAGSVSGWIVPPGSVASSRRCEAAPAPRDIMRSCPSARQ